MAIENMCGPAWRRWVVAAVFGLVHGFGFSFLLQKQLQFVGGHLLVSLLAFNAGIELGQLVFIAVVIPLLAVLQRAPPRNLVPASCVGVRRAFRVALAGRALGGPCPGAWPQAGRVKLVLWLALVAALRALAGRS